MRKKVYLDTTIPSYLFDERADLKYPCEITKKWWQEESDDFDIFTSTETVIELDKGNYPKKQQVMEFIANLMILPQVLPIYSFAKVYIENFLMPKGLFGDAIHLAYSSYYKVDFLLTWNCNHLANANKEQHIRIINNKLNLSTPSIVIPLQLFKEAE